MFHAVHEQLYMVLAARRVNQENMWKEWVGLAQYTMDWSQMLMLSIQAEEALKQWAAWYGQENNFIVMIGFCQYNLYNAVTMLKEILTLEKDSIWGIMSLMNEVMDLVQLREWHKFLLWICRETCGARR